MPKLIVVNRSNAETEVDASVGVSLMENLRAAGFDEIAAVCGGCCVCATCHIYVDQAWQSKLEEAGEGEQALLEHEETARPTSRLSCQIVMSDALNGLKLTIAPEH